MTALFGFYNLIAAFYLAGLWWGPFTASPFLLLCLVFVQMALAGIQIGVWIGRLR
jgi:hypothetical protein